MNERIKSIADAATYLFLQQGYSKTQISHIAKSVGVSVGTIYLDFTGKKEIMHFIFFSRIGSTTMFLCHSMGNYILLSAIMEAKK